MHDQGDLDLVLLGWGSDVIPETWLNDLPTGRIDQEELDKVLLGWENFIPTPAATAIPEPTTALLAVVLLGICPRCISRRDAPKSPNAVGVQ